MSALENLKTMQAAASSLGSAAKYIGAANLELAKVVAPALGAVALGVPKRFGRKFDEARTAETPKERQHAASVFGLGVALAAGLTVATVAHFVSKRRKSQALREQKRQVKAALKREKAIDSTLAKAVAMRPASALLKDANDESLAFAKNSGCYAILTYDPDVAMDDPSAYRDVFVGGSINSMLDSALQDLKGGGSLYVYADVHYEQPVYVAFFPCDADQMFDNLGKLIEVLGASHSYNRLLRPNAEETESEG